jgi:hypothetical protein
VLLASLLIFGLIIGGTVWRNANSFAQNPVVEPSPDEGDSGMRFDSIDEKALNAKDNNDSSVSELADEVFGTSDFAAIPGEIKDKIKDRVLRAEIAYRQGGAGIDEVHIAEVVNEYVGKFNAPEYAKTSPLQVRYLRATLMRGYPNFISQVPISEPEGLEQEVGTSINPTLSPLEAAYVTAVLLQQKMLNEEYQKTPQEWADSLYSKQLQEWQADADWVNSGSPEVTPGEQPTEVRLEVRAGSGKYAEMAQAITNSASTLWASNLQAFVDTALDDLGIPR